MNQESAVTGEIPVVPSPAKTPPRNRKKILALVLAVLAIFTILSALAYTFLAKNNTARTEYQNSWAQYAQMSDELAETTTAAQELLGVECAVNTLNPKLCNHGREILAEANDLPQLTEIDVSELSSAELSAETMKLDAAYRDSYRVNNELSTAITELKAATTAATETWWERNGKTFLAAGQAALADADAALAAKRDQSGTAQLVTNLDRAQSTMQQKLTALQSAYDAGMTITQGNTLVEEINQAGMDLRAAIVALLGAHPNSSPEISNNPTPPASGNDNGDNGAGDIDPQPTIPEPDLEDPEPEPEQP